MKQVTYAFIDSQNLNLGVRSLGWKLDFAKFRQYIVHVADFKAKVEITKKRGNNLRTKP